VLEISGLNDDSMNDPSMLNLKNQDISGEAAGEEFGENDAFVQKARF